MKTELEMVREFHRKYKFPLDQYEIQSPDEESSKRLAVFGAGFDSKSPEYQAAYKLASDLQKNGDGRLYRQLLMMEELLEVGDALATMDRAQIAMELADLLYTVLGTAVQFGLPLDEVFTRVHASNMTKAGYDKGRRSDRGQDFVPVTLEDLNCLTCGRIMVDVSDNECPDCRH